jgi:hypothetical protein
VRGFAKWWGVVLILLCGCSSLPLPAAVTWADGAPLDSAVHEERLAAEWHRSIELDGSVSPRYVIELIVWSRGDLPLPTSNMLVALGVKRLIGYCVWRSTGKTWIHLSMPRPEWSLRHELHHARTGRGSHVGPVWDRIIAEEGQRRRWK